MQNNVRTLRRERLWSRGDLAELLGVSYRYIDAIENGRSNPSLTLAYEIAEAFQANVSEVFPPHGQVPILEPSRETISFNANERRLALDEAIQ
jgi:putative transcriptional regulator